MLQEHLDLVFEALVVDGLAETEVLPRGQLVEFVEQVGECLEVG
jgi:hypothetical protein